MQGTRVDPWSRKIPHAVEWHVPQLLSLRAETTENWAPGACALQPEKPLQWEAYIPQLETALAKQQRPSAAKNKQNIYMIELSYD